MKKRCTHDYDRYNRYRVMRWRRSKRLTFFQLILRATKYINWDKDLARHNAKFYFLSKSPDDNPYYDWSNSQE